MCAYGLEICQSVQCSAEAPPEMLSNLRCSTPCAFPVPQGERGLRLTRAQVASSRSALPSLSFLPNIELAESEYHGTILTIESVYDTQGSLQHPFRNSEPRGFRHHHAQQYSRVHQALQEMHCAVLIYDILGLQYTATNPHLPQF